jgi:WD40 repeat protein
MTDTVQPLFTLVHRSSVWGAAWNEVEDRILTWGIDGTVTVWDVIDPEQPLFTLVHESQVEGAAWNSAEDLILTWGEGEFKVWDVADPSLPFFTLNHESNIAGAAWNPAGDRILTWGWGRTVKVWDVADLMQPLLQFSTSGGTDAAWNGAGDRILTWGCLYDGPSFVCRDRLAKVWDAKTGDRLFTFAGDSNPVVFAHWNQDESRILLNTWGGMVWIYYTSTKELAEFACEYTTRNFSWGEWLIYFPGQPYEITCPQWHVHPSVPESALP